MFKTVLTASELGFRIFVISIFNLFRISDLGTAMLKLYAAKQQQV
jgi:hypothetical protein